MYLKCKRVLSFVLSICLLISFSQFEPFSAIELTSIDLDVINNVAKIEYSSSGWTLYDSSDQVVDGKQNISSGIIVKNGDSTVDINIRSSNAGLELDGAKVNRIFLANSATAEITLSGDNTANNVEIESNMVLSGKASEDGGYNGNLYVGGNIQSTASTGTSSGELTLRNCVIEASAIISKAEKDSSSGAISKIIIDNSIVNTASKINTDESKDIVNANDDDLVRVRVNFKNSDGSNVTTKVSVSKIDIFNLTNFKTYGSEGSKQYIDLYLPSSRDSKSITIQSVDGTVYAGTLSTSGTSLSVTPQTVVYVSAEDCETYYGSEPTISTRYIDSQNNDVTGISFTSDTVTYKYVDSELNEYTDVSTLEPGEYKIIPDITELSADGYVFLSSSTIGTLTVNELYTVNGENSQSIEINENGWYGEKVNIVAANGYTVSLEKDGSNQVNIVLEDGKDVTKKLYFFKDSSVYEREFTYSQDTTPPTGSISVDESVWTKLLNTVTFGAFFCDSKTVTIEAEDISDVSIKYRIINIGLNPDSVPSIDEVESGSWTNYDNANKPSINLVDNEENNYIVYAIMTDELNHKTIISSEIISISNIKPKVVSFSPTGNNVSHDNENISITFDKEVKVGSGDIKIITIDSTEYVANKADVSMSSDGLMATIPISSFSNGNSGLNLDGGKTYSIYLVSSSFIDKHGNELSSNGTIGSFGVECTSITGLAFDSPTYKGGNIKIKVEGKNLDNKTGDIVVSAKLGNETPIQATAVKENTDYVATLSVPKNTSSETVEYALSVTMNDEIQDLEDLKLIVPACPKFTDLKFDKPTYKAGDIKITIIGTNLDNKVGDIVVTAKLNQSTSISKTAVKDGSDYVATLSIPENTNTEKLTYVLSLTIDDETQKLDDSKLEIPGCPKVTALVFNNPTYKGGDVKVSIKGTNLDNKVGVMILSATLDESTIIKATASKQDNEYIATLSIPENNTDEELEYILSVTLDNAVQSLQEFKISVPKVPKATSLSFDNPTYKAGNIKVAINGEGLDNKIGDIIVMAKHGEETAIQSKAIKEAESYVATLSIPENSKDETVEYTLSVLVDNELQNVQAAKLIVPGSPRVTGLRFTNPTSKGGDVKVVIGGINLDNKTGNIVISATSDAGNKITSTAVKSEDTYTAIISIPENTKEEEVRYAISAEVDGKVQILDDTVLIVPERLSSEKVINKFSLGLDSENVYIDEANSKIIVTLPKDVDITNILPDIEYVGKGISPDTNIKQDFSNNVKYTVTAEDGTTRTYTVEVCINVSPDLSNDNKIQATISGFPKEYKNADLISVSASSDTFNTPVEVRITYLENLTDNDYNSLYNMIGDLISNIKMLILDISVYDKNSSNKVQPANGKEVKVSLPIPEALLEYSDIINIVRIVDGKAEIVGSKVETINGVRFITFNTNHFSTYAICAGALKASNANKVLTGDDMLIADAVFLTVLISGASVFVLLLMRKKSRYK